MNVSPELLRRVRRRASGDASRALWNGAVTHVSRGAVAFCGALASSASARAQSSEAAQLETESVAFALSGGLALFAAVVAVKYISERKAWRRQEVDLATQLEETRGQLARANAFLSSEPQIFVAFDGAGGQPDIDARLDVGGGLPPRRLLAFGSWLQPRAAQDLETLIDRLRKRGERFKLPLTALDERQYCAEGCAVNGRAVLRIREVSDERREILSLRASNEAASAEVDGLRGFLEAVPEPVWLRGADGKLTFVNSAYARAVDAKNPQEAVEQQIELLDQADRAEAQKAQARSLPWRGRVAAVVSGARHAVEVTHAPSASFSAAIAIDRQEVETVRANLEEQMRAHAGTLDQLRTAVAIFDRSQRLAYRNAAYADLWKLDASFLDSQPTDSEILDRLRLEQRLPMEIDQTNGAGGLGKRVQEEDYKPWKKRLMEAYHSAETHSHVWHTSDGRTLRVVVHPNPQGGVTYLYDDLSEHYDLESRFNALYRMQTETLETLHEGVAVFGADGRLRLANPAFMTLWRLDLDLSQRPRFEDVAEGCKPLLADEDVWCELRGSVTGLSEMRTGFARRIERNDGAVLDVTAQPLPEGATLLTFVDVTADVNAERALTERNTALLAAEKLREEFIHHVSYELRSPLTNIAGFVHLLDQEATGPLNARQQEYLGYVGKSSAALLAIIDDILDLATIDKDAMTLNVEEVDAEGAMRAAIEGVQDRLAENGIDLQIVAPSPVGAFSGDAKRVRQILFNLLSNAIGFSKPQQSVTLAAFRREGEVVFKVIDQGRGIPPEVLDRVFERFESHKQGTRHRGVGIGLSIVHALMKLHHGKVFIDSAPGEGTTVTCIFPAPERNVDATPSEAKQEDGAQ